MIHLLRWFVKCVSIFIWTIAMLFIFIIGLLLWDDSPIAKGMDIIYDIID